MVFMRIYYTDFCIIVKPRASIRVLSLEAAAMPPLLGAQVIAEYESIDTGVAEKVPVPMRAEAA
ncbi:MAG: hypothetical protein HY848_03510 [Betaproteobacteria bacterium]|nr:hypothetical protein [Betaproteobacteria bacterium]